MAAVNNEYSKSLTEAVANASAKYPTVQHLTVSEVQDLMEQKQQALIFLDVRSAEERAVSTIPGSLSVDEFYASQSQHGDALVVAFCTVGLRSAAQAKTLQGQGFKAANLEGSILAWVGLEWPRRT
jgi:rhodanese-related sulfurtransferase